MNIIFRVDAALHIGSGHVMRCLTLAQALTDQGVKCLFICRSFEGNLCSLIKEKGYKLFILSADNIKLDFVDDQIVPHQHWLGVSYQDDAQQTINILNTLNIDIDWLIVDHYAIDIRWQTMLRPYVKKIMMIDDLADRKHDCDLLLDQTYDRKKSDYSVLSNCTYLLGSKYALLRDEFLHHRTSSLQYYDTRFLNDPKLRIFISMGGVDKDNITEVVLNGLSNCNMTKVAEIHIVMGKNAVWIDSVKQKLDTINIPSYLHCDIKNVAEIMSKCNLAIGAAGTTSWERCSLGMPSIVVSLASNQISIAKKLAQIGAHWYVDSLTSELPTHLVATLNHVLCDRYALNCLSQISQTLCDGLGSKRVINALMIRAIDFYPVTKNDIDLLYSWRNHPKVRASSFDDREIDYQQHVNWITKKLKDKNIKLLIAQDDLGNKVGCVRLDLIDKEATISIYLSSDRFGLGYGYVILEKLSDWTKIHCPYIGIIRAQIKINNLASNHIFTQAGYQHVSSNFELVL